MCVFEFFWVLCIRADTRFFVLGSPATNVAKQVSPETLEHSKARPTPEGKAKLQPSVLSRVTMLVSWARHCVNAHVPGLFVTQTLTLEVVYPFDVQADIH